MSTTRRVLCADFDQTITIKDTLQLLFQAAEAQQPSIQEKEAHKASAHHLIEQFTSELDHFKTFRPASTFATNSQDPHFDSKGLQSYLAAYSQVDFNSIKRVEASKILAGIPFADLQAQSNSINIRKGCREAFQKATESYVITSNWSSVMVQSAMNAFTKNTQVIGNELLLDDRYRTTGAMRLQVQSPADKAAHIRHIQSNGGYTIYVGDSTNDLLALLEADIGVCISSLDSICTAFKIDLHPLQSFEDSLSLSHQAKNRQKRLLFTCDDWQSIQRLL